MIKLSPPYILKICRLSISRGKPDFFCAPCSISTAIHFLKFCNETSLRLSFVELDAIIKIFKDNKLTSFEFGNNLNLDGNRLTIFKLRDLPKLKTVIAAMNRLLALQNEKSGRSTTFGFVLGAAS